MWKRAKHSKQWGFLSLALFICYFQLSLKSSYSTPNIDKPSQVCLERKNGSRRYRYYNSHSLNCGLWLYFCRQNIKIISHTWKFSFSPITQAALWHKKHDSIRAETEWIQYSVKLIPPKMKKKFVFFICGFLLPKLDYDFHWSQDWLICIYSMMFLWHF